MFHFSESLTYSSAWEIRISNTRGNRIVNSKNCLWHHAKHACNLRINILIVIKTTSRQQCIDVIAKVLTKRTYLVCTLDKTSNICVSHLSGITNDGILSGFSMNHIDSRQKMHSHVQHTKKYINHLRFSSNNNERKVEGIFLSILDDFYHFHWNYWRWSYN